MTSVPDRPGLAFSVNYLEDLRGVHAPDRGRMVLLGHEISPQSTLEAQELGISTVYQRLKGSVPPSTEQMLLRRGGPGGAGGRGRGN